jgi:SAM-dependent methyltransferase
VAAETGGQPVREPQTLDDAIALLRERVERRKASGEYPADLDARLEFLAQRARIRVGSPQLDAALARLQEAGDFGSHRISYASRVPLGARVHSLIGRVVIRQSRGIFQQQRDYATALDAVLVAMADMLGRRETVDGVSQRVDLILDRLATYERAGPGSPHGLRILTVKVKELQDRVARTEFSPWYSHEDFESAFRGQRSQILESLEPLARRFEGCGPVLDFGCGRGEMLELLSALGIEARGVELDSALAESARGRGLPVEVGDGMEHLRGGVDSGLGGLYLGQVIEHLTIQDALDVVALAAIKLREGGRLIIETVNNQSLYVFARSLYLDPTHVRPVPPAYLLFLVKSAGFREAVIDWRSPVPTDERLEELPDDVSLDGDVIVRINRDIRRINDLLFGPQDYALIATR